jgi:hypothetical protein
MQLSLFELTSVEDERVKECLDWLRREKFDIRRRQYETHENYNRRILFSTHASTVDYESFLWNSLEEWAEICPTGLTNRLPPDKQHLAPHDCFFLKVRDIIPDDWLVPIRQLSTQAQTLPKRATYRAINGDIFLSRFKEPLGKCVLYQGQPSPLYVSSNYFLLRPKSHISPPLLLSLLKSPFLAVQLHRLIQRGSVVTEMFIGEACRIRLPKLPPEAQHQLISYAVERIQAEAEYKLNSCNSKAIQKMNEMDFAIAAAIMKFASKG